MPFLYFLLLCLVGTFSQWVRADIFDLGQPYFAAVGDSQTLPSGVITSLVNDSAGFLWIGTQSGLVRYDGYTFKLFQHKPDDPNSLPGNYIKALFVSDDEKLYIGTSISGLSVLDLSTGLFVNFFHDDKISNSLVNNRIAVISQDKQGGMWIGTSNGLDYLAKGTTNFIHYQHDPKDPNSLNDNHVRTLLFDNLGQLWIGSWEGINVMATLDSGLKQFKSDTGVTGVFETQVITSLMQMTDGTIWLGTVKNGIARINPDNSVQRFKLSEDEKQPWVFSMLKVKSNQIWVATYGQGIIVVDASNGKVIQNIRHDEQVESSINTNNIASFLIDPAGLLWIGTWGKWLNLYNPVNNYVSVVRHKQSQSTGLSGPQVLAVKQMHNRDIWLGLEGKGIDRWEKSSDTIRPVAGFADKTVISIEQTTNGDIWLGTMFNGLMRYFEEGPKKVKIAGLETLNIYAISQADNNNLWVGAYNGFYYVDVLSKVATPQRFKSSKGKMETFAVNKVVQQHDGRLWAASVSGLFLLQPGETDWQKVRLNPDSKVAYFIAGLLIDENQQLWVSTPNDLYFLTSQLNQAPIFVRANQRYDQNSSGIGSDINADAQGRIWSPYAMFDPTKLQTHHLGVDHGEQHGIGIAPFWHGAGSKTVNELLLFGGTKGLLIFRPEDYQPWSYRAPLVITQIKLGNQITSIDRKKNLSILPSQRSLSVEFAALDMFSPKLVDYQYWLEGFDSQWVDSKHRIANYTNLDPGDYELKVRFTNRHKQWFEAESLLHITVIPKWYQTLWFKLLSLLLIALVLYSAYLIRVRQLKQRKKILKILVKQRTEQLVKKTQEVYQTMENLKDTQAQLVESEKQAGLGKMVAGVAHELNTPLGVCITAISAIDGSVENLAALMTGGNLTKSAFSQFFTDYNRGSTLVGSNLRRAGELVDSFKLISGDQFDQKSEFELTSQVSNCLDTMRDKINEQNHHLIYSFDKHVTIKSYRSAFEFIIRVLVENALEHGFEGCTDGRLTVDISNKNSEVILTVQDDGIGIQADELAFIFDPFYTSKRGSGHCGLDLHIIFNIVNHKLDGTIDCQSQPGKGCKFMITLAV
ncbi:MAG: hypothetical protein HRT54_15430 [Colwellia sp.]|nr:hypothetical protein [Colwellia sp.]